MMDPYEVEIISCCMNCNHYDNCAYEDGPGYCYRKNTSVEDCRNVCEHYSRHYPEDD